RSDADPPFVDRRGIRGRGRRAAAQRQSSRVRRTGPRRQRNHAARLASAVTAYRPDIDGLRAIAVVAVVLFHAHFGPFTGGFVGVDVFFVISGYLIVGMIVGDLRSGHFSIAAFYERRLRRLFPALFVVMAACAIAGYLLFLPEEFRKFGQSLVAT